MITFLGGIVVIVEKLLSVLVVVMVFPCCGLLKGSPPEDKVGGMSLPPVAAAEFSSRVAYQDVLRVLLVSVLWEELPVAGVGLFRKQSRFRTAISGSRNRPTPHFSVHRLTRAEAR
jgi:hypothetical protein